MGGSEQMNTLAFFMSFIPILIWITYGLFFIYIPSWIYEIDDKTDYLQGLLLVIGLCAVGYFLIEFMNLYFSRKELFT
jgi:hypothetical protein